MRRYRRPLIKVGGWLVSLVVVLLLVQILCSVFLSDERVAVDFYNVVGLEPGFFLGGRLWTVLTYPFFHHPYDWTHFVFNALGLLYFGGRVTHVLGSSICYKILTGGILAGALYHLFLDPHIGVRTVSAETVPLIGISGGMCALLACLCTVSPDSKFFPLMVSGKNLLLGIIIMTVFFILINPLSGLRVLSNIGHYLDAQGLGGIFTVGHACHLGGLVIGVFYTNWLLRPMQLIK